MPAARVQARPLEINPPLLNSACPWATTQEDLQALYDSPYTGAVTTRTSLLDGFPHDDAKHQYLFFNAGDGQFNSGPVTGDSSLNTLGYSPLPLSFYIGSITAIVKADQSAQKKPFIISATGTPTELTLAYIQICRAASDSNLWVAMEVNLSCPNLDGKPPPAYDASALGEYLGALEAMRNHLAVGGVPPVPIGIKTPPYTYIGQFKMLFGGLKLKSIPGSPVVDFITATNTLGSSLVLSDVGGQEGDLVPALDSEAGTGVGGLAGAALHPLALGNVSTLRRLFEETDKLKNIMIIGVGGVSDPQGYKRMRKVGANAVALATALGREGVNLFEKIGKVALEEDLPH